MDGSSGAIGTAVNRAIDALVPIIAAAPADATTRDAWLERLWDAHASDGVRASRGGTYLATFRAVARKYPHKRLEEILADLVAATPGEEGKWFAAAKELGLYDAAIELARASPCDPRTLARAARDHAATQPAFAVEAGCAALDWLVQGFGYEITGADVWMAYSAAMRAAEAVGRGAETTERIRGLAESREGFVRQVLGRELGLVR